MTREEVSDPVLGSNFKSNSVYSFNLDTLDESFRPRPGE